ncbi:MAG: hypothetical protein PQJ49_04525 [Sphaerochaetaceae bacterium]|nr:hypothetical protein [Sphaerochaetaceae bacterium]
MIFTIITLISTVSYLICSYTESEGGQTDSDKRGQRMARKWMWWSYPFMITFWLAYIGTPSKKDALLIVAGGQTLNFLASDESAKQIPSELSGFVLTELKTMAKEAQVELGIQSQKEKILQSAKEMTSEELLKKIKTDSIFKKTLLE